MQCIGLRKMDALTSNRSPYWMAEPFLMSERVRHVHVETLPFYPPTGGPP